MHDIKIKAVLNGYIVKVGCQTVVFGSRKKLFRELDRYLDNPSAVEREYLEKYKDANEADAPSMEIRWPNLGDVHIVASNFIHPQT